MIIHIVRFTSRLDDERVHDLFAARIPENLAVPGLEQKYYLHFADGQHGTRGTPPGYSTARPHRFSERAAEASRAPAPAPEPEERFGNNTARTLMPRRQ